MAVLADTIEVYQNEGRRDFSLRIDGEEFPLYVTYVSATALDPNGVEHPGVTVTIPARNVSFIRRRP